MKSFIPLLITFLIASSSISFAQSYKIENEPSTLSVIGTSTLHDWKIKAEAISGSAELVMADKKLKDITSLLMHVNVADMHSGLDPMDAHMRSAMTANESSTVDYKLLKVTNISPNTIDGYTIQAEGEITIIGNKKEVTLQATMEMKDDGTIRFFGETMLDMTEYSVELPQAEMGSIKAEKDVKIVFDVILSK